MSKHRRKSDGYVPPAQGQAGTPDEVAKFDANVSRHAVEAADKRLFGQYPYDNESGSKAPVDPNTGLRREQ